MAEQVKEIRGQFSDITVISELRGAYPNVPIAVDVDYAALIAGDDNPVFLTIPIGKAGVTSGNNRHYDEAWLQELERQVLATKPIGLMGHLSPKDREWAMPPEAVHWVGVTREQESGLLWGKGYIPPGEARERIRRYKAQGKSIATSISCGPATVGIWDEKIGAYRMQAKSMVLEQIDIAPTERAGIRDLATLPILSNEMDGKDKTIPTEVKNVDKLTVINEMTAEDARLLPDPVRAAVLATVQTPAEVATVASIRETLGLDPKADVVSAVTEMRRVATEQAKTAVTSRITELVNAGIKIEDVRPLVTELITARNPQTVQAAEDAYKAVSELESVKKLLASHVQETMGPPQRKPVQSQQGKSKYFDIPKKADS